MTDALTSKTESFPTPWRVEARNVPIADTGDYDGVLEIRAANGALVVESWNPSDDHEEALQRIVRSMNAVETTATQFIECDTCRAKPGSPTLCAGCLHNRGVIEALTGQMTAAQQALQKARDWIRDHAKHDESGGSCYGRVRPRPHPDDSQHTCKCGLDELRAALEKL